MPEHTTVEHAVELLKKDGIVILPTDTVCGIACSLACPETIKRLYQIKDRPLEQATALLIDSVEAIPALSPVAFSADVKKLLQKYWPGGLTVVVPRRTDSKYNKGLELVCGGAASVGLRIPDHPVTIEVIRALGAPLVASSANLRSRSAPASTDALDQDLLQHVDAVIEGICSTGVSSTVIDLSVSPPRLLREGALTRATVQEYLPDIV